MSGIVQLLLGAYRAATAAVDPFFNYVTALLHGDGTNGAQNNTFLDSSINNFTITRNGNTTQGTFSPFSQTGWSNYFDGNGDGISFGSNVNTNPASSDITVEAWIFPLAYNSYGPIFSNDINGGFHFGKIASGFGVRQYGTGDVVFTANTPALNQWTHVAVSRSGSSWYLFFNGIQVATATASNTFTQGTACVGGNASTATEAWNGYLSNVRFVKGTALYTSNFTPSTTPLTAVTNTQLLTCQDNRYKDNSSNAYAVTVFGTPSVQAFSPFNPTSAWSASSNGGSGYFDGSGDYLSIANNAAFNLGTNSFCIDGWFYPTTTNTTQLVFNKWGTASDAQSMFQIGRISSTFYAQLRTTSGYVTLSTATWIPNAWNHFAVVRSGSTISAYLNGSRFGTDTSNPTLNSGTDTMTIGSKQAQDYFTGYITDCRIVNGSAIYDPTQTSITVPTAPTTAVTNTAFLSSNTNAGIYDNAAVGDYETVGNAQVSTSVYKYGTGSMAFDGTGDYLTAPSSQSIAFGTGDFTLECWTYITASKAQVLIDTRNTGTSTSGIAVAINASNQPYVFVNNATLFTSSLALSLNTWYFIACVKVSGTIYLYVNGTLVGSAASSTSLTDTSCTVGTAVDYRDGTATLHLAGYIDDLRITKGLARYTYNFTPPTAAFPNIGGTVTLTADPYFRYTTLLLPGNGTNGAQNNTFLDSSSNAFTITRNGNTTQGNFSPFSQTGWGNYFDASSSCVLTTSNSSAFTFGTGDFTIEMWIYPTADTDASGKQLFDFRSSGTGNTLTAEIVNDGAHGGRTLYYYNGTDYWTSGTWQLNQWQHIAFVRSSGTSYIFINGTLARSTFADSVNHSNTAPITVGGRFSLTTQIFAGYISNFRVLKGTGLYTANFTPPTVPLTAITNTSFLTCQSNRFVDNSTNALAITNNGTVSVQAFSPFAPTAAWSASTNGGSGYFDGSGDYLTAATNAAFGMGTGDFTLEGWVYSTETTNADQALIDLRDGTNTLYFYIRTTATQATISTNIVTTSASSYGSANQWVHFAVSREGTNFRTFINGNLISTTTNSTNFQSTAPVYIGQRYTAGPDNLKGWAANIRIVKGTAVYTAAFTPPTAPLTAISGTSLLLSATNGGIVDATAKNDLETVGNAQISTTQSKFGGSSMYFDGTGDWLYTPSKSITSMGGDFTVEGWVYLSSTAAAWPVFTVGDSSGATGLELYRATSTGKWRVYSSNVSQIESSTSTSTGSWVHLAVVRYSGSVKLYVNGINEGSAWSTSSAFSGAVYVAAEYNTGSVTVSANGYIDDFRITLGIARYTSNFTPPTSAFLLQ